MYRLKYFKATNCIGFISGIGKRSFELDLTKLSEKDLIVVHGDNASGKSTFLSMVHPWNSPSDGRTKFIVPGKEGTLIRSYCGDDGTTITTKCIYRPKPGEDGHNVKCFFEIEKPDGTKTELNPDGNVKSYQSLLYTYFGLTKDFIGFATYNTAVAGIVKMTDSERKDSVSKLVPNVSRYENAYMVINDKYKELRALLRNIAQKIVSLRDEDSLRSDVKRINDELTQYAEKREDAIRKRGKAEGRLKELTHGKDVDNIMGEFKRMVQSIDQADRDLAHIAKELHGLYHALDIECKSDTVYFDGADHVGDKCLKLEIKIAKTEASLASYREQYKNFREQLYDIENQIVENETMLYGIQAQNVDDLIAVRDEYNAQLKEMTYAKDMGKYEGMSYDEVINFSRSINTIYSMIQALYDEYGELLTQYFSDVLRNGFETEQLQSIETIKVHIETKTKKRDQIYRELIEKEQYRRFQGILEQRPKSCTIDSCPFISNALKWSQMSGEIEKLKAECEALDLEIQAENDKVSDHTTQIALYADVQKLRAFVEPLADLFKKYFGISIQDVYTSIVKATWENVLSIMRLKEIAAVLSEKELYEKITKQSLPEVEHAIEMARLYGTNRQMIKMQLDKLYESKKSITEQIGQMNVHMVVSGDMLSRYQTSLKYWEQIKDLLGQYREKATEQLSMADEVSKTQKDIGLITELQEKERECSHVIDEIDRLIEQRMPVQQKLKADLLELDRLKAEKAQIEVDFNIVEILRSIVQPGKGLRKELINIYMYDIYQTANQLLLNTFNGNLYLKEFIITDKEFIIPYVYNGTESPDISYASASQQAAISISISMAILSKIMGNYGIVCFDEADAAFSPANREIFIDVITTQMRYIGIRQGFLITQNPADYINKGAVGYIRFPGGSKKNLDKDDVIDVIEQK